MAVYCLYCDKLSPRTSSDGACGWWGATVHDRFGPGRPATAREPALIDVLSEILEDEP